MLCLDLSCYTRLSVAAANTENGVSRDIPISSLYILYARSRAPFRLGDTGRLGESPTGLKKVGDWLPAVFCKWEPCGTGRLHKFWPRASSHAHAVPTRRTTCGLACAKALPGCKSRQFCLGSELRSGSDLCQNSNIVRAAGCFVTLCGRYIAVR